MQLIHLFNVSQSRPIQMRGSMNVCTRLSCASLAEPRLRPPSPPSLLPEEAPDEPVESEARLRPRMFVWSDRRATRGASDHVKSSWSPASSSRTWAATERRRSSSMGIRCSWLALMRACCFIRGADVRSDSGDSSSHDVAKESLPSSGWSTSLI